MTIEPEVLRRSAEAIGYSPYDLDIEEGKGRIYIGSSVIWNPVENDSQLVACIEFLIYEALRQTNWKEAIVRAVAEEKK